MRRIFLVVALLTCLILAGSAASAQQASPTPVETIHTVQPGETLFSIARRYGSTVNAIASANGIVNRDLLLTGQQLRIPTAQTGSPSATPAASPTAGTTRTPSPTPQPGATTTYAVAPGDTLYRIAVRFRTTIRELIALNPQITNPNIIYLGQRLNVPDTSGQAQPATPNLTQAPVAASPTATIVSVASSTPIPVEASGQTPAIEQTVEATPEAAAAEATAEAPIVNNVVITADFEYGVVANFVGQNIQPLPSLISRIKATWVKQEVLWRDFEPVQGQINFAALDPIIDALEAENLSILLTVTTAPTWARSMQEENGPPDNYEDYAIFVGALAARYAGRVDAYEIWSEPNIRSRWKSVIHPIGAEAYLDLLRLAFNAVKAADPNAVVVSAGLAPTGFNDALNSEAGDVEVNAVDDRVFLSQLYQGGLPEFVDAVGAHPMGWANPPDAVCCTAAEGVTTHFESPTFYFLNTLQDYRQIMTQNSDGDTPIWVTKFGWGTSEDLGQADEINIFMTYTSLDEQAQYITRAFEIGATLGYIGPMFLYNLNGCQTLGNYSVESCYYALIGSSGVPRPAYAALEAMMQAAPTAVPTVELPTVTPIAAVEAIPEATAESTPEATAETTPSG